MLLSLLTAAAGCSTIHLSTLSLHPEQDWGMFGKDPAHSSFVHSAPFTFPMSLAWKYDASAGFGVSAVTVVDSVLLVGTLQGELHAVHALTGKRIGYKKFSSPIGGSAVVYEDLALFGLEGGRESFIAFNLRENRIEWSAQLGSIDSSPLLFGERIYVGGFNGTLYCLSPAKGEERWRFETKGAIRSSPAAHDSTVVLGNDNGTVYACNTSSGAVRWQYQTNAAIFGSAAIAGETVFIGSRDHFLYALDIHSGILRWKFDAGDRIVASPSVNDSLVFVSALNGSLTALRQKDGTPAWSFNANSVINSAAVVTSSALFIGSLNTEIYALSPIDGSLLWKEKLDARIKTSPIVWNDLLYVAAEDRTIYCFRPRGTSPSR